MKNSIKESAPMYNLVKRKPMFEQSKVTSSKSAADFARKFYHEDLEIYESMFIMLLNNSNQTIGYAKISQGGITGTVVDVRIIAKYCVESLATACIMVHNHPSGKTKPSNADKSITEKVKKGLELLDIKLLDHVILTETDFYSFADESEL